MSEHEIELVPATQYTVRELVDLYNQTRVDYLVPMPMNANRLQEYINDFDVSLEHSFVARDEEHVYGLGMLGLRAERAWITRLGVLPISRRKGIGGKLMSRMLEAAEALGKPQTILEVIKDNTPAHNLFTKLGFKPVRNYTILRRAPFPPKENALGRPTWLDHWDILDCLAQGSYQSWVNAPESMANGKNLLGFRLKVPGLGKGWVALRIKVFSLTHLILHVEEGDPVEVGTQLLRHLHHHFPRQDTYAENIEVDDPLMAAFQRLEYFEVFQRIELVRENHVPLNK